jgi:cyclic beta-1,2-glucan synthetase
MAQSELLRLVPEAPPVLLGILDGARGPVPPPIRSEIFGLQRFAQHGRSLGVTHRAATASWRTATFFPRLRNNIATLREAHHYIGVQASTGYDISPAAEWLLDNFHLIEAQLKEIHEGLPRSYFRTLPMLVDEPLAGLPRVYGVAWAFVAHTDGAFDEELLSQFLSAYQETRELNLSEMWALPTTLRVVLIENLRRLAERVATHKAAREVANLCCDAIERYTEQSLDELLALLSARGVGRVFLAQMAQRLQSNRTSAEAGFQARYRDWLQGALPDLASMQTQRSVDQAADNLSVSNAVTSLRTIGDADWPDIVERTSTLMQVMLSSPVFQAEHATTRDQTLHGIERLARRSRHSELSVAKTLLDLMQAAQFQSRSSAVASHWLHGPGRPGLVAALGLHEPAASAWHGLAPHLALPAYLGALLLGTLGVMTWMLPPGLTGAPGAASAPWLIAFAAALMLFPASEAVVAVINRLISESARPQHLPRLALVQGIPREHAVLVVIPAMLSSASAAQELVHRLQLHYLANPEPHAQFALLSDWADADSARSATDEPLLAQARAHIGALNARYPRPPESDNMAPRFILLHRERLFCETEQRWIGWERKRGKLEQLVAALAQGTSSAFLDLGEDSRIAPDTPYIVTLDSDTQLPPGRLRELVGVAAHPRNQPQLDATGRCVVAGYGIFQPRVATPLPAIRDFTLYHWLFAGQCGIDPYSAASSEVYQDVFGEGTFTGKGLLNVRAMHAVLAQRLPQGQVLSHDLLEGSIARCAVVTDITVIEDAPFHADVAASRVHRWTRGDWQLLPLLLTPARYGLRAINRWKMFDNLRRSLVAPMLLGLLLLALGGAVMSPWLVLALALASFTAGPLMGAVAGFSPSRDDLAKRHFYQPAAVDLARALWGGLWHVAQLLQHALMALDAVLRALHRTFVSRRHLLQWTTAASAQACAKTGLGQLLRQHWGAPLAALLLLAGLVGVGTPHPALATALCLLWAGSPVWTWLVSRHRPLSTGASLPPQQQAWLEAIARDTWRLFERCVDAGDHHLPPDNLQTEPHDMVAHRTSPTNIGLYLLSVACARQFGWISTQDLIDRLEATLATLAKLQRHRGHFLNWYDTQTLAPLLPMYVSTVDSGNLSGHLLAVAQACLELARAPVEGAATQRLRALAQTCEQLADATDFSFLYHRKRHLLHIGYRVAEQQLDAGFYDLLASESRLTSLLAIAKGDVPVRHWASLGRPFYADGSKAGLRSWSGSMFEYLMPCLVLDEPHGSVLRDACQVAIREQMTFARSQDVPWGISECAYAGRDHTLAYQYAPQGVPRLALRRTPPDELVIAPYATALAAQIDPQGACANFKALEQLAARARYGFIEALDFSPARQSGGEAFTPVLTFMAHHQGMSLVALANVLLGGVAQRWGMANPHIQAVASLLHERAPREVSALYAPNLGPPPPAQQRRRAPRLLREVMPGGSALEPTQVLSNGRYSVSLRANGAGWSRWGQIGINRWRDDALRDRYGSFFYVRWPDAKLASITQHPAPDANAHYHSVFHSDRVCFDAVWSHLHAHSMVWVSPEDDIEFRQVELRNLSDETIELELISAFEPTLTDARADEAHPAFTNLFMHAQWLATQQALLFERKPRLPTEQGLQLAHFLAACDPQVIGLECQTDRQRWLGRNHAASQPRASFDALPGVPGDQAAALQTGLDPVCALSVRLRIAPNATARLTFATAACESGATLRAVIDKYRQPSHVERASLMSATLTGIRLRALRIGAENFAAVQTLSTALLLTLSRAEHPSKRSDAAADAVVDRRLLWRFGISGDRALILVSAGVIEGLGLLRSMAQGLSLWAWGGVACDLVVINAEPASYQMALQRELAALRERHGADGTTQDGPKVTGFYVLRADEVTAAELSTLQAHARVQLNADGRPLSYHVQEWVAQHEQAFEQRHETSTTALRAARRAMAPGATARGGFTPDARAFEFDVSTDSRPDRPWINVLANPTFGAQLSEAGGGYTWARNSRLNQLTAWSNDPVADPPAEWFLLQDLKTMHVWSVTPNAWSGERSSYRIAHGQGYSTISHRRGAVEVQALWCVDAHSDVKQVHLRITNHGPRNLQLRVVGMVEWMMGANRADRATAHTAVHRQRLPATAQSPQDEVSAPEQRLTALLCTQREQAAGFGGGTAFWALAGAADEPEDWTCDRRECFDARGQPVLPDHYGQGSGEGLDPCAALSCRLSLGSGQSAQRVFLLGYGETEDAARQLATLAGASAPAQRLEQVHSRWDHLLGATTVSTPDPLFDALVNRWLLYQAVSCRLWAKSGFYQAGGATGFRDQLQDTLALSWAAPELLRQQIVLCASRQFAQGDVQHWWHAPQGAGVRTHFSDDLLWLPHACVRYLRASGDASLLDQLVPFIDGGPIPDGSEDAYYVPSVSAESASVYEHAARAIDRSLRVGAHGLPLMGSGDWNDGMNRVGAGGRGESVWLGWFLCQLVADFSPLARQRGDTERAQRWDAAVIGWKAALSGPAWDGQWFKRAFFDDGQALGSRLNAEARIDLIAQAWSVLSGSASTALQRIAMAAVESHLVDHEAGLIRLLDPPLANASPSAGYIQAYPGGVRENGSQYSHAGVWALMAQAQVQQAPDVPARDAGDTAYRYFTYLSPAHRAQHPQRGPAYGLEPYVMAADVYSQPPYVGRGGWSWYTGAAAWLHRAAIESIFGLRQGAQDLSFTPCLPAHWERAELTLRRDGRHMRFILLRATPAETTDIRAQHDAQLLRPGEALAWPALVGEHCFVIPLLHDSDGAT